MSMILYTGGRLDSVQIVAGLPFDWNTMYDHSYADCSLGINPGTIAQLNFTDTNSSPISIGGGKNVFFHGKQAWTDGGNRGGAVILQFIDSAGFPWVQLTTDFYLQVNTGTGISPVWTTVGVNVPNPGYGTPTDIDIKIAINAGGAHTVSLFVNRVQYITAAQFNQNSFTNLAAVQIMNTFPYNSAYAWSELLITEGISTIGAHVQTCRPNGAGDHSDWTGSYTDVNEQLNNDTTVNQTTTSDQTQTYTFSNVTVPVGYRIASATHYIRAKNDGSTPANIKSVCRVAGTDYVSTDMTGINEGFSSLGVKYDNNPATGTPWTEVAWNSPVQFGFKSDV